MKIYMLVRAFVLSQVRAFELFLVVNPTLERSTASFFSF